MHIKQLFKDNMKKIIIFLISCFVFNNVKALEINSTNYILYNLNDDQIVLEKNMNEQISVASLTKIMTVIVALENIDNLDEKVIITNNDFKTLYELDAATAGLYIGERVTYRDLLYCTLLASGAECAQSLANNISGDIPSFVNLMNAKAKELNLSKTHFENVIGLDSVNHHSSVGDIANLLKYSMKNEKFKKIFETKKYTISDNHLDIISTFWYTSYKYNYDMDYVLGAKTGYTDDAGKCLASLATDKTNKINYMLVTCGADTTTSDAYHVKDAYNIYNYYFANYKYQTLVSKGDVLVTLDTKYSNTRQISFYSDKNIDYYLNNDYDKNLIRVEYDGIDTISYKNKKGDKLGVVSIYYDNEFITNINIILNGEYRFSLWVFLVDTKIIYGLIIFPIIIIGVFIHKKKVHIK